MHLRSTSMMLALLLLTAATGCRSARLSYDGNEVRGAMLQLYEDQAMDNLIRVRRNQPIVHLEFKGVTVQETDSLAASYGSTQNSGRALAAAAARTISTGWNGSANASNQARVSYEAEPLNNDTGIYDLYREFADNVCFLCEGSELPEWGVHLYRKHDGYYYWIPTEYSRDFYEFVLATTFDCRKEPAYHGYYDVVISVVEDKGSVRSALKANLQFDKTIPQGYATAIVELQDGREVKVSLFPPKESGPGHDAQWSSKDGFVFSDLQGRKAKVYSAENPPPVPASRVEELLEKSARSLNLLRANQN
ncbi:MAG: hypothetical protein O2820_11195 [Planctomycetota bacterium]|nr:hypothetical protein [Planctomycetota bacterium]MDA1249774.1 hypothetical protein [Planctomycetota bacterium]